MNKWKIFVAYIKDQLKLILLNVSFLISACIIFMLYNLHFEAIFYVMFLWLFVAFIYSLFDFSNYYQKHQQLQVIKKEIEVHLATLPISNRLIEQDYQQALCLLQEERLKIKLQFDNKQTEMMDYYTMWAHQVKTPIATMKLLVQTEPSSVNKELLEQIFKMEQYVDMVLGYLRIDEMSADLMLQKYRLSDLVKQVIRKYASQFIRKNIKLEFQEMETIVITDEKWLVFVLEQLLSNALKYTNRGTISIYMDFINPKMLVIEDTGIGIAEEDLPRIFEKGYTGYNGRMDKKATGIGLYLCHKILNKLGHNVEVTSEIGVGTKVMIDLSRKESRYE